MTLIERLRDDARSESAICHEAADEIERLRAELAESEEIKPPVGEIGPWLAIESHLRCALNAITTARRGEHSDLMLDAAEYQARCGLDVILRARAMHEHQADIETSRFAVKLKARGA